MGRFDDGEPLQSHCIITLKTHRVRCNCRKVDVHNRHQANQRLSLSISHSTALKSITIIDFTWQERDHRPLHHLLSESAHSRTAYLAFKTHNYKLRVSNWSKYGSYYRYIKSSLVAYKDKVITSFACACRQTRNALIYLCIEFKATGKLLF